MMIDSSFDDVVRATKKIEVATTKENSCSLARPKRQTTPEKNS